MALLLGGVFFFYQSQLGATNTVDEVTFEVVSGESSDSVLSRLESEQLIHDALIAKVYMRLNEGYAFKAGTYELSGTQDLNGILTTISDASQALKNDISITFIEGDWLKHMAAKIEDSLGIPSEEMMELWSDEQFVRSLMSDYSFLSEEIFNSDSRYLLEGYLMPNTYSFSPNATPEQVTRTILNQSLLVYEQYKDQIEVSNLSIHEVYTLASIVQYESATIEDMGMISGVFYNRIDSGWKLESSVTVCYAIDLDEDGSWQDCETNPTYDSPYNTYMVSGLPPGPILNPGEDAIAATLNPTESDYYFFLAAVYDDGKVYYSETLAQHNAYKATYLDGRE